MSTSDRYRDLARLHNPEAIVQATTARRRRADLHLDLPVVAPSNDAEACLVEIWQEILGLDAVGIDDTFFELNGDSMAAVQVLIRVHTRYGVEIPIETFFDAPTVRQLANVLMAS